MAGTGSLFLSWGFFLAPKHLRGRSSAKHLAHHRNVQSPESYNISFWLPRPSSEPTWSHFKISRPWSKEGLSPCAIPPRPPTPDRQSTSVTTQPPHPLTPGQWEFLKLMVIAFQGPSVFTLRRSGSILRYVACASFQSASMNLIK